jgi:hypothetical protein
MMEKLPRVTAGEAVRVLERAGFLLARQSGSHKIYKKYEDDYMIDYASSLLYPSRLPDPSPKK